MQLSLLSLFERKNQRKHRVKRRPATRRPLKFEALESRQLLAVVGGGPDAVVEPTVASATALQADESPGATAADDTTLAPLDRFGSAEAFRQFLIDAAIEQFGDRFGESTYHYPQPYPGYVVGAPLVFTTGAVSVARPNAITLTATSDFSLTNVQVDGVDEGDIVETDGEFLYIASDRELTIVDVRTPDDLKIASRIEFDESPTDMFLFDDRLTLIFGLNRGYYPSYHDSSTTQVVVVDVSDAEAPSVVQRTQLQGDFVEARAIDQFVYLVSRSQMTLPQPVSYCGPAECYYETQEEYVDRVENKLVGLMIPRATSWNDEGDVIAESDLIDAADIYQPESSDFQHLLSVVTFDMLGEVPGPVAATAVPEATSATIYASPSSLYLIGQASWNSDESVAITKFNFVDEGRVELVARGEVSGRVLNQFSVDEHDGFLRIATTTGSRTTWRNHLFVLEQQGQALEVVGKLEDLAPGEKIYSARFMGDRAYIVTFVKVDPLFAIDLSDPTSPQVLGELKVPGFSDYLQPIDENHLIGIGRNANEVAPGAGWTLFQELQISLFDVSDMSNPELIDRYGFEGGRGTNSEARLDHHAVSYFSEFHTLVIPVDLPGETGTVWHGGQSEFRVFKIDVAAGIEETGSIEFDSTARRSLRIDDLLFTISTNEVKVHELQNPAVQIDALTYSDSQSLPPGHGNIRIDFPTIGSRLILPPVLTIRPLPETTVASVTFDNGSPADEASLGVDSEVRGEIQFDEEAGRITIYGTDGADVAVVKSRGDRVMVRVTTGAETSEEVFDRGNVSDIVFAGFGGDDQFCNKTDITSYAFGHAGNDRLIGGSAADQLFGGDDDDRLSGNAGDDRIEGGDGDDRVTGGAGDDVIRGQNGNDRANGNEGNDRIMGGAGDDWLAGQDGDDRLGGGNGVDRLLGGDGDDTIEGGAGNDNLAGGNGRDFLSGGEGNDAIRGNDGNDIINGAGDRVFGGDGNDRIVGGLGGTIHGGAGNDRVQFTRDAVVFGGDGDDIIKTAGTTDVWLDAAGMFQHSDEKTKDDGENRIFAGAGDDVIRIFGDNDAVDEGEGDDQTVRRYLPRQ